MDVVDFLSKAFWFAVRPGNLVVLILLVGTLVAWIRPARSGRYWLTALSAFLVLIAILPLHIWIAQPLEQRFPLPVSLPAKVNGILVLGGFYDPDIARARGQIAMSEASERIMVGAALARRHPEARLVIAGYDYDQPSLSTWLSDVGVDLTRVEYETESRNTFENASFSYRMLQPAIDEVWLLVTTAQHMPRSVGVFRKVGWAVIPYPVDYQTTGGIEFHARWPDVALRLFKFGTALKEWIGLVAYYAMSRTDELYPGPGT